MVLSSKFSGNQQTGGTANVLTASLNFMVDPTNAEKRSALVESYGAHKPGNEASLTAYFRKIDAHAPAAGSAPAASKAKPAAAGSF